MAQRHLRRDGWRAAGGSPACRLRMVALADGEAGGFELGGVHTVDGSLGYRENEAGWTLSASKQ